MRLMYKHMMDFFPMMTGIFISTVKVIAYIALKKNLY